jgi:hypothetical protein
MSKPLSDRERLARELYGWGFYAEPSWWNGCEDTRQDCYVEADRIIALLGKGKKR